MAFAGDQSGTETIDVSVVLSFVIDNTGGHTLVISYDIDVIEGAPVSIYFHRDEDSSTFQQDFIREWSSLNTTGAHMEWEWSEEGIFDLAIIIPDDSEVETSTFEYDFRYFPKTWRLLPWILVLVPIIVIVAIAVIITMRRRGRTGDEPHVRGP